MSFQEEVRQGILPLDEGSMREAAQRLDQLTKPPGSLGQLESLIIRWCGITGGKMPRHPAKGVLLMAGDHGVVSEGVTPYPQTVTAQMVQNILAGGAAINAVARAVRAQVTVVDVGVCQELPEHPRLWRQKVRPGTANLMRAQAMTLEEAEQAVRVGINAACRLAETGVQVLALGEMGIGNTTPSSCLLAALTGLPAEQVVGMGTSMDERTYRRKVTVVKEALRFHRLEGGVGKDDLLHVMACVGGLEIAALAGAVIGAARARIPVVLDGFIVTVAGLWAVRFCPPVKPYLFTSHVSAEKGHQIALDLLDQRAPLHFQMRLGEGTGAGMMLSAFDVAAEVHWGMATFAEAGVDNRKGEGA
ncbi:MAG: nicotinate-nucleotide--dimethylbenzimidazole phosphoribosyltransferase [Bacillus thermozeamaize]|uniref:Nicotinate-nucleotide--dimethylbenzimidazole phosphoribosyltransferase n=1 Tax=Bacillus thermozeamaize TaxID=230954 RepID=A0A1Y3PI22_9BACI|nr:MAG: nicotinate-nucleotide--dimethylbenzimidazole phosphoribosyltransferase [Bacillus thermozeamaize]